MSDEKSNIKSYCYKEIEVLGEYRKKLEESIENNQNSGMDVEQEDVNDEILEKHSNEINYTHSITPDEKKILFNTNKSLKLNDLSTNMHIDDINKLIQNK